MDSHLISLSKHFEIQALAKNVYAAIAIDGGHAVGNAGMVDLGGQVLVFDTFVTPQAAADLRQIVIELFGRAPRLIIDSHYHNDHIWGNQVFAGDAHILSSSCTRELIATEGMEEYKWYGANAKKRLESLLAQTPATESERQEQLLWKGEYEGIVEALPHLSVCLPDITFDRQLEIHGTHGRARLVAFNDGHTKSDTILHLPEEGVIFAGDLLFVGCHPYLADGNPFHLPETLKELSQHGSTQYVPGHGPVGTLDDVRLMSDYVKLCIEKARGLEGDENIVEAKINESRVPEEFLNWKLARFWQVNIRHTYGRMKQAREDSQGS